MDPASYARAFGVQSESNKVTVTRVASNEIVYRRAVDTYRRDMASTMTNIQRQQKKLKRNMRHYRRRLREAQNIPIKKSKPFKIGWIAYDTDTSFINPTITKPQQAVDSNTTEKTTGDVVNSKDINSDDYVKHNKSSKLQAQVETFLKSVDEHVNARLKRDDDEEDDKVDDIKPHDNKGRRRFLFGPGQIGRSDDVMKYLKSGTDGHFDKPDFLSDTSSEVGKVDDEVFRGGSGKKRPKDLVRLNSAYFTPISMKPDDKSFESHVGVTKDKERVTNENDSDINPSMPSGQDQTVHLPSLPTANAITKPNDILSKNVSGIFFNRKQTEQIVSDEQLNEKNNDQSVQDQVLDNRQSKRRVNKLNFGDLIKFQHGVNTKKLFSMVDQLASKYGVQSTEQKNRSTNKKRSMNSNARQDVAEADINSKTKSSFFYAMKYGYGKPENSSQLESSRPSRTQTLSTTTDYLTSRAAMSQETHTESYYADQSTQDEYDMPDSLYKAPHKERKTEFPHLLNVDSYATHSRQSILSDFDENDTNNDQANAALTTENKRHGEQINNRRSSILDASNYVSNMRRKSVIQARLKVFEAEYNSERLGHHHNRRFGAKKEIPSEYQRKADDSKIPWTSALGQMKLVHSLGDLTDFI